MDITPEERGKLLESARKKAGLTLAQAAESVGVNRSTVLRWERGDISRMRLPILNTLADLYGVPVSSLLGNETDTASAVMQPSKSTVSLKADEMMFLLYYRSLSKEKKELLLRVISGDENDVDTL